MASADAKRADGVMVNGYWYPSLAAAAEAPASTGFDFAEAEKAETIAEAARAKQERRQRMSSRSEVVPRSCVAVTLEGAGLGCEFL